MAGVSIRPRKDTDLPACVEILKAVSAESGYPVEGVSNNTLKDLQSDDQAWVAEENDVIIGHVALNGARESYDVVRMWREQEEEGNVAVLARLFVHPDARNRGAATMLVRTGMDEADLKGWRLLILALVKDRDAIRLYRRLGWTAFGTTVYCWGEGMQMDAECLVSPVTR